MQVDAVLAFFLTKEKNVFWGSANQQCLYTLKPTKVQRGKELKHHFKCDTGIKPAITRNIHSWHAFLIILSAKWQGKQWKENAASDLIIAYKKEFVVQVWVLELGKSEMMLHDTLWQSRRGKLDIVNNVSDDKFIYDYFYYKIGVHCREMQKM